MHAADRQREKTEMNTGRARSVPAMFRVPYKTGIFEEVVNAPFQFSEEKRGL